MNGQNPLKSCPQIRMESEIHTRESNAERGAQIFERVQTSSKYQKRFDAAHLDLAQHGMYSSPDHRRRVDFP
jgi:hypothetical protein